MNVSDKPHKVQDRFHNQHINKLHKYIWDHIFSVAEEPHIYIQKQISKMIIRTELTTKYTKRCTNIPEKILVCAMFLVVVSRPLCVVYERPVAAGVRYHTLQIAIQPYYTHRARQLKSNFAV